jgi:hypothetical protein
MIIQHAVWLYLRFTLSYRDAFLGAPNYCRRYRPAARHAQMIDRGMGAGKAAARFAATAMLSLMD